MLLDDDRLPSLHDAETRMLQAMLASDVDALDSLVADEVVFTLPDGSIIGKQADLEAHRAGSTRFVSLDVHERRTQRENDCGTTETRVDAVIRWQGARIETSLTYRRSWRLVHGRWQVVAGSAAPSDTPSGPIIPPADKV